VKYVNRFRVTPGSKVKLKDIDPGFKDDHASHEELCVTRIFFGLVVGPR
jgi:hypothetical protein